MYRKENVCHVRRDKRSRKAYGFLGAIAGLAVYVWLFQAGIVEGAEQKSRAWAILIGVQNYRAAPKLLYTLNDVERLTDTLVRRGNYSLQNMMIMVDTAKDESYRPWKKNLEAELPLFLKRPGPDDRLLVYFSGHGFRDKDGKMYLAPLECDPNDVAATGIPIQWLRGQIAECRAHFKLLILDACHAGSEKGDEEATGIAAGELGESFRDLEGVVTFASSQAQEKSLIWGEMQQSLFSWWLNEGLKGHADANGDNQVTIDELYAFVHRNVTATARNLFNRDQTPVRIVRTGTPGVPVVMMPSPTTLRESLSDMSEELATAMRAQQLTRVGVIEFLPGSLDAKIKAQLGGDPGLLGRWCAAELEKQMANRAGGHYEMVAGKALQKSLSDEKLPFKDLHTSAVKNLLVEGKKVPVIAEGRISARTGRTISFYCALKSTDTLDVLAEASSTASLDESEWAMIGRSVALSGGDRTPELGGGPPEVKLAEAMEEKSKGPHPLLDKSFPFRVDVMVGGKKRELVFDGANNNCYVPLSKGEVYSIQIENNSANAVLMRLLVDGLNTLPETEKETKGVYTTLVAKRVNLDEAAAWKLDPAQTRVYSIPGYFESTGEQGKYRQFEVVDAEESTAARQKFTEQIGIITAAFYAPKGKSRGLGTKAGAQKAGATELYDDVDPGNLLGVVHIHYVEPEAIKKTANQ